MWRSVHNYLRHAVSRRPEGWYPLLAVYYLTYACDFRCPYCSDGAGQPYWKLRSPVLRQQRLLELLRHVRRHSDYLVLTGGEPLRHPDFAYLLDRLPELRFDGVVLTTIGHGLAPHLELVNRAVRYLVFSLETLDHGKADGYFGKGPGALAEILQTIERARQLPGRRYEMIISAVATPDNLDDLFEVFDFARQRGYRFALCPQLQGVHPHPDLRGHPTYRRLLDHLIESKRRGEPVNGSVAYLEHMRDLREFSCRPSTVLAIAPTGDVFYPCLERGNVAGNLLETPDLHALRRRGEELHGAEPSCGNQCQSACALGFSLILEQPLSMAHEASVLVTGALRKRLLEPR